MVNELVLIWDMANGLLALHVNPEMSLTKDVFCPQLLCAMKQCHQGKKGFCA